MSKLSYDPILYYLTLHCTHPNFKRIHIINCNKIVYEPIDALKDQIAQAAENNASHFVLLSRLDVILSTFDQNHVEFTSEPHDHAMEEPNPLYQYLHDLEQWMLDMYPKQTFILRLPDSKTIVGYKLNNGVTNPLYDLDAFWEHFQIMETNDIHLLHCVSDAACSIYNTCTRYGRLFMQYDAQHILETTRIKHVLGVNELVREALTRICPMSYDDMWNNDYQDIALAVLQYYNITKVIVNPLQYIDHHGVARLHDKLSELQRKLEQYDVCFTAFHTIFGNQATNMFDPHHTPAFINHMARMNDLVKMFNLEFMVFDTPAQRFVSCSKKDLQIYYQRAHQIFLTLFRAFAHQKYPILIQPRPSAYLCNYLMDQEQSLAMVKVLNAATIKNCFDTGGFIVNNETRVELDANFTTHICVSTAHNKPYTDSTRNEMRPLLQAIYQSNVMLDERVRTSIRIPCTTPGQLAYTIRYVIEDMIANNFDTSQEQLE
jgi:hypothetical protein